jgi:hypothetical protein
MIDIKNGIAEFQVFDTDAKDGRYCSVREFAIAHNVSEERVRVWIRRKMVKTVCISGKPYINLSNGVTYKRKKWELK